MTNPGRYPRLPERIGRLADLAHNFWWSWHPSARNLFRVLDYSLWRTSGHNPVKQLRQIAAEKLEAAAADPAFLDLYDSVISAFDSDLSARQTWFADNYPNALRSPIAYFSMEFAIHNSLPMYAGGLGILSGDIAKEASDLGVPLVGVGFMFPQGYFRQRISRDGWQEEIYRELDLNEVPVTRVLSRVGGRVLAQVPFGDRNVFVAAWRVRVGRVSIYLLDTGVEENSVQDQKLSSRLYIDDQEMRLQQEMILGIGGVRVLRGLGIEPAVWHANEGHTAFMMLERVREEVERGATFDDALRRVRASTVFTTHTPVRAAQDIFPPELMRKYFEPYCQCPGLDQERLFQLGQEQNDQGRSFNTTAFSLRTSGHRNGVSQLHGMVTRKSWHALWPDLREDEVPISYLTNGIHVPTWVAPEMNSLYEEYLGRDWIGRHDDPRLWDRILEIPDERLWAVRQVLKSKLMGAILERAQQAWTEEKVTAEQVLAMGALLDPDTLTVGFVRRVTEYKRPALIFRNMERLKRIVNDPWQPVQVVFAGKSHPADLPSKRLLQEVYRMATDRDFQGRVAFVEDYDMHMARYLAHGVDVWLNTPRRLQEACGTSGMKASLNGVPHLSIADGWWFEGHNGTNGWVIGDRALEGSEGADDREDAEALYQLLEEQVVPLYYLRDRAGVPQGWIRIVKEAIRSVAPLFSTKRMLKEYLGKMYLLANSDFTERDEANAVE